jgi:putative nucleotidyltransferase with HDIG domain
MYRKLLVQGETQPDLLVAALLHDVGKLRYRLNPLERAMIVLAKAFLPAQVDHWGSLPPGGWESLPAWRKAFVLSKQHATWGAELAHQAGVSPLTESLIRQHHQPCGTELLTQEDRLLNKLRLVDNQS